MGGELLTPGNILNGRTTGTLTVFTARGTLTLSVTSPLQKGFSPLNTRLYFTITGGTGAYANNHSGTGTINVSYRVTGTTGSSLHDFSQNGPITLVFRSGPIPRA